jgi:hypothetical protein
VPHKDPIKRQAYQKRYFRKWYKRNHQSELERARQRKQKSTVKVRQYIVDYLSTHPCIDCGETDIIVLEFDHVRGKKKADVASMIATYTLATVKKEIAKCDVRCANCHRRRHGGAVWKTTCC